MKRRGFIKQSTLLGLGAMAACTPLNGKENQNSKSIVLSTWNHGLSANVAAWNILQAKGSALDAVEAGVRITEANPAFTSVGLGGLPDRDGRVTLDACIMNEQGEAGSVAFLENIMHPISVARKVMEETPHVMLVGEGAEKFAYDQGFKKVDLLTKESEIAWKEWLKESEYKPIINVENHDTIGMIAIDDYGNLSGACTTSGLAFKQNGRVGDSPIIGAGLFVDNEIGAATATGLGEEVIKTVGSFLIVELMRQGANPQAACEEAANRIIKKHGKPKFQVGYLALSKKGEIGAVSIHPGFQYAITSSKSATLKDAKSMLSSD